MAELSARFRARLSLHRQIAGFEMRCSVLLGFRRARGRTPGCRRSEGLHLLLMLAEGGCRTPHPPAAGHPERGPGLTDTTGNGVLDIYEESAMGEVGVVE